MQVVLQRGTSDKESVSGVEHADHLSKGRLLVLDTMRFVDDDVLPSKLLEGGLLAQDHLVTCDADIEILVHEFITDDLRTFILVALQDENLDLGNPLGELAPPVVQCGLGHGDEVGSVDAGNEAEVSEEGDGLQGLSETHLVG